MHTTIIHKNYVATYNGQLRRDVFSNTVLRGFTLYSAIIEYHVEEVHEKQIIPYTEAILFGRLYELLFSGNILRIGGEWGGVGGTFGSDTEFFASARA